MNDRTVILLGLIGAWLCVMLWWLLKATRKPKLVLSLDYVKLTCAEAGKIIASEGDRLFSSCELAGPTGVQSESRAENNHLWLRFADRVEGKGDQKRFDFISR